MEGRRKDNLREEKDSLWLLEPEDTSLGNKGRSYLAHGSKPEHGPGIAGISNIPRVYHVYLYITWGPHRIRTNTQSIIPLYNFESQRKSGIYTPMLFALSRALIFFLPFFLSSIRYMRYVCPFTDIALIYLGPGRSCWKSRLVPLSHPVSLSLYLSPHYPLSQVFFSCRIPGRRKARDRCFHDFQWDDLSFHF